MPSSRLILVGTGPQEEQLMSFFREDDVLFLGVKEGVAYVLDVSVTERTDLLY